MKKLYPFTEEENQFAEAHLFLVDKFLRRKRLSPDDYYDIVIFGYLEAVQKQYRDPIESEKQNFPAFAEICMRNAIGEDWKYRNREMRRGNPLSLDQLPACAENDDFSFYDVISDGAQNPAEQVEDRDMIDRILGVGTKRELEAIRLVWLGYEPREASRLMGIAPKTGRTTLAHFRKKAKAVREEREIVKCPYYERNREAIRAQQNNYRRTHAEYCRARDRAHYEAHREEINARRRAHYAAKRQDAEVCF